MLPASKQLRVTPTGNLNKKLMSLIHKQPAKNKKINVLDSIFMAQQQQVQAILQIGTHLE